MSIEKVKGFIVDIVLASAIRSPTHDLNGYVQYGASNPCHYQSLTLAARRPCFLHGRGYVTPPN